MNRFAIIGNSGSGKSTLAALLAREFGAATLDLDTIAWEQPPVCSTDASHHPKRRALESVRAEVCTFCNEHDAWIVEGCYGNLIAIALEYSPQLFFLNPGVDACIRNCKARPWEPHKFPTPQAQNAALANLIEWVQAYDIRTDDLSRAGHRALFENYSGLKREITDGCFSL